MIYEVRARLFFDIQDEAVDFYHDCELAFAKSTLVNEGAENEEAGFIDLIENHHDEDPNGSCMEIAHRDNHPTE